MRTGSRLLLFFATLALAGCNCQPPIDPCAACLPEEQCQEGSCVLTPPDAGGPDSGVPLDAGADSGTPVDSGTPDAGQPVDAGAPIDSGTPIDAGTLGTNDGGLWCVLPTALNCSADLQPVQLTVTLTLNGQPFPAGASTRGFVRFLDKDSEAPLSLAIPATGAATATATLLPGAYDVLYASGSPITGVPMGSVTLAAALVVSTTGAQTYDLKTAPISGTVTVNGSPFPNSTSQSRGDLLFREPNGAGVVAFPMGNTGPVAYSGHVFRTTYDVVLETITPVFVKRTLASAVVITVTSIRTDDLVLSAVSGTITLDGQTIPNSQYNRGSVEFYEPLTGAQIFAAIGMTGPAAYATQLPAGSYDVYLLTSDLPPAPLPPWARTKLASALTVNAPATLNWNTQSLELTGTLTLDGQTFPIQSGTERGKLWLRDRAGNKDIFYTLPATGPATVNLRLFKGTYDIGYQGPNGPVTGLPRATRAPIALGTTLSTSTNLPMNLETVLIGTSLTVDGQPRVTDEWYGSVFFTDHWGGTFGRGYPASGPAVEPMLAYKNVPYDVSVAVNPKVANPAVAQGQVVVRRNLKFLASGPLALDATTISASGSITHNGLPLATSNVERGEVHMSNLVSGWHDKVLFGKTGPAVISTKVFSSPRDVSFIAAYDKYLPLALTGSPTFRIKRACLASECRAMSNDVTGTWQLTVFGFFGNENRLQLVEQAGAITGELSYGIGYSILDRGTRSGSAVRFIIGGYNPSIYTGVLESPCRMTGVMDVPGYYSARFVAIR